MPDPTPSPAPAHSGSHPPTALNQGQIASITKTEEIIAIARKEQYFPRLAPEPGEPPTEFDITQAFLDSLADQCEQARLQSGQAVDATSDLREETAEERAARLALLETIHAIQARARQKHYLANPHTLDDYGIGQRIDQNRATLLQWAATIYTKSGTDPLPKITTTIRQQLQTQRATYLNSHTQQTGAQGTASALRLTRDELLKAIIGGRQRIQFAADAEWPFTNPANHPIRMEFQLPASRPFVG